MPRLAYLCLQATVEGQASYAHVHEIISGLKRRGWDVTLYEPSYASTAERSVGILGRLFEFLRVQFALWRGLRGISALYIRSHFAAFPTALLSKAFGIPVVHEVNGPYEDLFIAYPWTRRFKALFVWLARTQLQWADRVITVTPQLRTFLVQDTDQHEVAVIPNGANAELFHPEAEIRTDLAFPYVVFFGALAPWQGIRTILRAVQHDAWPEGLRLVVVGDGAEREQVQAMAANLSRVVYLGKLPYRKVPSVVAGSIAGLSPQTNLGGRSNTGLFALKVFETLSCGVPVVVTDFPGQADVIRANSCGLVIREDDAEALACAVAYLYKNPSDRVAMGMRGRELVLREFSWDHQAGLTETVLLSVARHSPD